MGYCYVGKWGLFREELVDRPPKEPAHPSSFGLFGTVLFEKPHGISTKIDG